MSAFKIGSLSNRSDRKLLDIEYFLVTRSNNFSNSIPKRIELLIINIIV